MRGPAYWRHLAEEHGACLRDFMAAGVQPALCYEQAVIAGHFAHLYLEATTPPDLEAPEPGEHCPRCQTPTEVVGFCGVCERKPMTLDAFLRYAVRTCVEGTAARPGLDAPPPDAACRHCSRPLTFVGPDWCSSCDGGES